jgi:ATP-binding cassette, subfamily B, bacterial
MQRLPSRSALHQTVAEARRFFMLGRVPVWTTIALPCAIILSAALGALPPLFIGKIIDALQHRDMQASVRDLLIYMGIAFLVGLIGLGYNYTSSVFRETLSRNVQLSLLEKINHASFEALSAMTLGQVTNRILGDVRQLTNQLEYSLFPVLSNICSLIATAAIMLRLDYRLALIAFVSALCVILPLRIATPRISRLQLQVGTKNDELFGTIAETASIAGAATYRNAAAARRKAGRIEGLTADVKRLRIRSVLLGGMTGMGTSVVGMIGPAAVMAVGAYLVVHGQLSVGAIVAILIYQSRVSAPITSLSQLLVTFGTMGVTVGRLLEIANLPEERSGSQSFALGAITLRDIRVSRDGRDILTGVNLGIEPGRHVALVGPSGAGKSSIASLIVRLYEPTSGTLYIGASDIRDYAIEGLRNAIGFVSQDPFLINASMRENISLNSAEFAQTAFDRAISTARLDDVIARLPNGLDTILGDRGFRLSGGERQRICLARALLQDPQILIFDEALTGVDIDMERQILVDVREMFSSRTLVVITHRVDSVRDFDSMIALEHGAVVASGPPEILLADPKWHRLTAEWDPPPVAGALT